MRLSMGCSSDRAMKRAEYQCGRSTYRRGLLTAIGAALLIAVIAYTMPAFRQWTIGRTPDQSEPHASDAAEPRDSMSQHTDPDQTREFHRIVSDGNLEDLRAALEARADVNAPGHIGKTALMVALGAKDLEKSKLLVQHGADPEVTDDFNHTALQHAVVFDFTDGVRYLLTLNVDRGHQPKYPLKKVNYDFDLPDTPMPVELREFMSEEQWKESSAESDRRMRELWQNPTVEPIISEVESVDVLKLFLDAGDDLALAPAEIKRALVGLATGGELRVGEDDYRPHKSPRYGVRNPERMDFPFWKDMVRTGGNAYSARTKFEDNEPFTNPGVVWCFDRFGSSLTEIADGRFVQIGGEHEDFYDPDFFIYNDVVVHDGRGNCEIYGYPEDVFPPTDFHTATLCPDGIYIIGCLGYPDQRQPGSTPVYRLTLGTWQMTSIETSGDMPGWIYRHRARYVPERNAISISGGEIDSSTEGESTPSQDLQFELNLSRRRWERIE